MESGKWKIKSPYAYAERMAELYNLLEDRLSKEVFWARLRCDSDLCLEHESELYALSGIPDEESLNLRRDPKTFVSKFTADGKKLFLYGAKKVGEQVGSWLLKQDVDFYAYCARNHEKYVNGVNGKQVFSPSYVFERPDECRVLITSIGGIEEICDLLASHGFPKEQIAFWVPPFAFKYFFEHQYFEFPELFPRGTAFVDAGCYDGETSKYFADWCDGEYSKIFAFEPDPKNCEQCRTAAANAGLRLELFPAGLSNQNGTLSFAENNTFGSFFINPQEKDHGGAFNGFVGEETKKVVTIQTVALDSVVKDTKVGFIKMDIEGSELSALHGAENTILRDKPLLAISVYHRRGDTLAIMDYLHGLMPDYHFWLRHHNYSFGDTVLYASITRPKNI